MQNIFFVHQIKHTFDPDLGKYKYDKGIVVKELDRREEGEYDEALSRRNYEAALQAYHAYLGAYAYEHDPTTDYVSCEITDLSGARLLGETWSAQAAPEPAAEPAEGPAT